MSTPRLDLQFSPVSLIHRPNVNAFPQNNLRGLASGRERTSEISTIPRGDVSFAFIFRRRDPVRGRILSEFLSAIEESVIREFSKARFWEGGRNKFRGERYFASM